MNGTSPENVLLGDTNMGIDLPQVKPDDKELLPEKQMANYAKTEGFAQVKKHCEERIDFYQKHLPNGLEIGLDYIPNTEDWRVANRIIGEFKLLMNKYDNAVEVVENAAVSA